MLHGNVPPCFHQVEYSRRYEQSSPSSQSCVHLLSEGHLLLRTALLLQHDDPDPEPAERRAQLQQAFQESCAHLGDCFSRSAAPSHGIRHYLCQTLISCFIRRFDKMDYHLALPYYKMSGLPVTDVIKRNMSMSSSSDGYGRGFLFFLKHSIYEENMEELSKVLKETPVSLTHFWFSGHQIFTIQLLQMICKCIYRNLII